MRGGRNGSRWERQLVGGRVVEGKADRRMGVMLADGVENRPVRGTVGDGEANRRKKGIVRDGKPIGEWDDYRRVGDEDVDRRFGRMVGMRKPIRQVGGKAGGGTTDRRLDGRLGVHKAICWLGAWGWRSRSAAGKYGGDGKTMGGGMCSRDGQADRPLGMMVEMRKKNPTGRRKGEKGQPTGG
jgi:hypothetical protein